MKSKIIIIAITLLSITINTLVAQSTTGRKIERVGKDVEKTGESVEKGTELFKKIFQKKDRDKTEEKEENTKSSSEDASSETTKDSKNIETGKSNNKTNNPASVNSNKLKPGDVHPDAVVLDVDDMFSFHNGAAIVKKGSSTALISANGEFIVPYNTYKSSFAHVRSKNGFFFFDFDHKGVYTLEAGYINDNNITSYSYYDQEYIGYRDSNTRTFRLIDRVGKRYNVVYDLSENFDKRRRDDIVVKMSEGLITIIKDGKFGFKNIQDKIVVNPIYDEIKPFSDGAAIVGKVNEFGEMKYGYIDIQGKAITPIQYSRLPEDFSWGYAKVYHNNGSYSKYSLINKKGEIVLTDEKNGFDMIYHGFAISNSRQLIWKTNGNTLSADEYCQNLGLNKQEIYGYPKQVVGGIKLRPSHLEYSNNPEIIASKMEINFLGIDKQHKQGIIDMEKGSLFYAERLYFLSGYEKKSKLALVHIFAQKGGGLASKGYINEEGIFMIVQGEPSKW